MRPERRAVGGSVGEIATVRIELVGSKPLIWRQVEVPTSVTLQTLHRVIQATMGWASYHLWEFTIGGRRYGPPPVDDWDTEPRVDAGKVRLRDVLAPRRSVIQYVYDFGDDWEHRLIVDHVRPGDPALSYPRYIGGEHNGPPEDCGGVPGFYRTLKAAADPAHPDHAEAAAWLGDYDPDVIDEFAIKQALARLAKQRAAVRARVANRNSPGYKFQKEVES